MGNRPAKKALPSLAATAVVPGSLYDSNVASPTKNPVVAVAADVKTTKKTRDRGGERNDECSRNILSEHTGYGNFEGA